MNFNDEVLNRGKRGKKGNTIPLMGPPVKPPSKRKNLSTSSSELRWGKSHVSVHMNSSSNRKSTSSKSTADNEEDKIIVALTEGRGEARCEVGIAAINVSRPFVVLCQTSDSQSYINTLTKINIFNPSVIIYPTTFETGKGNRLIEEIRKYFPQTKLITLSRQAFNKGNGLEKLYQICLTTSFPLLMMIKNRYYALAAASGLLTYLRDNLYIYYASHSIKIEYQASEGYAIIDISSVDRLELVYSNQPAQANKYSSLFGIMNRCLTRVGARHLRSIVLQPLYAIQKIDERLDCVEELIRHPDVLQSLQGLLPKLSSIDQLLSLSTLVPDNPQRCTNRQVNYLLLVNSIMDTIQPLKEILKKTTQPFFLQLRELLADMDFDKIKKLIRETIHEDAYTAKGQQAEQQRIWAIKPGLNGLLDLVRKTYSERVEDMREYTRRLGEKYDLALTLANNNKKGYHIVLPLNQIQRRNMKTSDIPEEFIQVFRLATCFTMKTVELVNLSTRIDDILKDLFTLSNLIVHQTIIEVKPYAALFYRLVEGISYLDVLQSLAEASHANGWVRPKFDEYTEVTFGRHPLLDFLLQTKPVSNPVVSCEQYNLHIVTGPNGAGKSIFIRQVMLLQIMAQAGCFVPAQTAIFRPADKMFARISNEDDMECSASSFVLEMTEVNYILTTMTSQSLIIIDELCRSTSVEEGTATAMGICEDLARSGAYTYVTTHFTLLTKLADLFVNIKVWQLQTTPSGQPNDPKTMQLDYKYNLIRGTTALRGYGIYMVRNIWPQEVLKHVDELQGKFTKKNNDPKFPSIDRRVRLKYDLQCKLNKLKLQKKLTIANLNKYINEYNNEVAKIGETPHNSQIVLQDLHSTMEDAHGLDHSIFDASKDLIDQHPEAEISKIYLNNIQAEDDAFQSTAQSELSYSCQEEFDNSEEVVLSPVYTHDSLQTPITSPSEAKRRMQEIFTPGTNLESFHSQSTYYSIGSNRYFGIVAPEVNLSCSASECSLNLTKNALNLEEDHEIQIGNIDEGPNKTHSSQERSKDLLKGSKLINGPIVSYGASQVSSCDLSEQLEMIREQRNQQISNTQEDFLTRLSKTHSSPDCSKNFFQGSKNINEPIEDYGASQLSSCDLSQELQMIREQRKNLKDAQESFYPLPELSSEMHTRNSEIESPFINTFVRPLQSDTTRTSTPLVTKIKPNARNFGSSYTSTNMSVQNKTPVTTPKFSFTISQEVADEDLQSVQEALESFVEDLQNEEVFSEEDISRSEEQYHNNTTYIFEKDSKVEAPRKQLEINKDATPLHKTIDFEQNEARKNVQKYKNRHIFPVVKIIEGPNAPSFDEDNNCSFVDKETVVRPIVRNPQSSNQEKEVDVDVLIKAFNSLSEPKNPVSPQIIENVDINTLNEKMNDQISNCKFNKSVDFGAEQWDATTNNKTGVEPKNTVNSVDRLIDSLSNPRKVRNNSDKSAKQTTLSDKSHRVKNKDENTLQRNDIDDCLEPVQKDNVNLDSTLESVNESDVQRSRNNNFYENDATLKEIEENSNDLYESARSATSYSVLASPWKDILTKGNKLTVSARKMSSEESVCLFIDDFKKRVESVGDVNETTKRVKTKYIERVEEVIELSDNEEVHGLDCENGITARNIAGDTDGYPNNFKSTALPSNDSNLSNFYTPILNFSIQEIIKSSITDYDKSTEKFPISGHNSLEKYGTETQKCVQKIINIDTNTASPQKNRSIDNRKSNFYSNLSADSDSLSNHEDSIEKSQATNIQTVDKDTLKSNVLDKVGVCEQAVQKEKKLMEKIRRVKNKKQEDTKGEETKLNQIKPSQRIPYLSPYSTTSSSGSSVKQNKTSSLSSVSVDLNSEMRSKTRKGYSRKRTLGIARYKPGSKDLKFKKLAKKNSETKITGEKINPIHKIAQITDVTSDNNAENASEIIEKIHHKSKGITRIVDKRSDKTTFESSPKTNNQRSLKRRKFSQTDAESTSFLVLTSPNKIVEEKTITSVSEASKLRNLDGDFSSSSSGVKRICLENELRNPEECEESSSNGQATAISDASVKRNLDRSVNSTSSSDTGQFQNTIEKMANQTTATSSITSEKTNENQRKEPLRLSGQKETEPALFANIHNSLINRTRATQKQSKLTKKAIKDAFYEQDKKFYETSGSSAELAKIWEQRMRRPSLRQFQQSTCLATLRKTEAGVEIIPANKQKKRKTSKFKGKFLSSRSNSINMNIFSDKNANTFDEFIKSDKKDYKSFNFNFGSGEASTSRNDGKLFNFKQDNNPLSKEYIQNKNISNEFPSVSQQNSSNPLFLSQNLDFTLTPEGFYKENRDEIGQLLRKYR